MKIKEFILSALIFLSFTVKGQNLFFIGEKSFPCTKSYVLDSNSDEFYISDLNLVFAKDENTTLIGVRTKTDGGHCENLIIYLDDGSVISLSDNGIFDYVDKVASSVYVLSNEELNMMKKSNINTLRYTLLKNSGYRVKNWGSFSASNKSNTDFPKILSDFLE